MKCLSYWAGPEGSESPHPAAGRKAQGKSGQGSDPPPKKGNCLPRSSCFPPLASRVPAVTVLWEDEVDSCVRRALLPLLMKCSSRAPSP